MKIYTVLIIFGDINSKASLPNFLARTNIQNWCKHTTLTFLFTFSQASSFYRFRVPRLILSILLFFFHELSYMQFEANQSKLINYLDLHVLLFNTLDFGN